MAFAPQVFCSTCGQPAIIKIANTERNNGREFYACPRGDKVWIGWADEEPEKHQFKRPRIEPQQCQLAPLASPSLYSQSSQPYASPENPAGCDQFTQSVAYITKVAQVLQQNNIDFKSRLDELEDMIKNLLNTYGQVQE